ncbi:hypothetical protein O2K51_10860 [Apibacter raozihei]|uniref:hypothetical protein n=1 Tax=Apibacter raozihei TaxID=2500547 RepID=UPI000FE3BB3C|nr:hypothetical protein [Apibacter raozihei]
MITLTKKKIDVHNFKWKYYIRSNEKVGYKHYVLKYYNVINNDSLIIWFTLDDEAGYFVEGNDNFYKYVRKTEQ